MPRLGAWGHPAQAITEKADVDNDVKVPLCTYGRDEDYINNKLWINGVSTIILHGAGDGMIIWCALVKRIPIMVLYDSELHKSTLETFLVGKIQKKMEEAAPGDARWWRTNVQLGCRAEDAEEDKPNTGKPPNSGKPPKAGAKNTGKPPKRTEPEPDVVEAESSAGSFLNLMGS